MTNRIVGGLLLCLICSVAGYAGGLKKSVGEKEELEKLQGAWKVVSAKTEAEQHDQSLLNRKFKIVGNKLQTYNRAGESEGIFTVELDPSKAPKHLTLTQTRDDRKVTVLGIYSLEKGKLHLCWSAKRGGIRPSDFKTRGTDNEFRIFVLEKLKE